MAVSKEHKEILCAESASKTLLEWLEYFGIYSKNEIQSFCYHNGLKLSKKTQSQNTRKYHINQDYFKTWSRNMAYIFGFWCADGCIYRGQIFDITLHKKDKYILKRIANELGYEGVLWDSVDRQVARLNFSCIVIYNDILALGGKENKSMELEFPKVPEEYLADFIRGYFDGSGSAMKIKGVNRINTAFTCESKNFLTKLHQILEEYVGTEGGSYDSANCSLKFGNKDSLKIGEFMYKNNPELFLLRKKEKFPNI